MFFTTDEQDERSAISDLILVVGNHDIGFHYDMLERKLERFDRSFNNRYITLTTSKKHGHRDIYFVSVNSMAMENDGCRFCASGQQELKRMNETLECLKQKNSTQKTTKCSKTAKQLISQGHVYSRPIVFTHFPLFRASDSICPQDLDSELSSIGRNPKFIPKFDCLSKESTKQVK